MFGYIRVDDPYLYKKDEVLYNGMYCGICKAIGKQCGQKARFTLNYDITFLSIIIHNILGEDVVIKKKRCATHWIKPRPTVQTSNLLNLMADINVLLAFHKNNDDIIDNNKGKIKKLFLNKGYKKASKRNKELNDIILTNYNKLRELENNNCTSIDMVSDPFATMLEQISSFILKDKTTFYTQKLFYNLGKWIYLIDALDDFEKDKKNHNFNVFICNFGKDYDYINIKNDKDVIDILNAIFAEITICFNNIKFNFNTDLIYNILQRGLNKKTQQILNKEKKIDREL